MLFSDTFRAMDTEVDVTAASDRPLLHLFASVRLLFGQQEELFSRFRRDSALAALNGGEAVALPAFVEACRLALQASEETGGLFNPMVLPALAEAGYSATFGAVQGGRPRRQPVPQPAECLAFSGGEVRLRRGQLDLGGIVKGWTVDLAVEHFAVEAAGLLVNAGGDLRAAGSEPGREGWLVAVEGPEGDVAWEGELRGALATSTTVRRRWRTDAGGEAHHLIDPRTGLPAESPFVQVSAWAPETWRAEVWAKAVLIGGEAALRLAEAAGVGVLPVRHPGLSGGGRRGP